MPKKDPFQCLLEELVHEFVQMNELCKKFEKRHNKRMAKENTKWKRFVDKVTGRDTHVKGDEIDPFVDNSNITINKMKKLEYYFNDMKCRYLWALTRIAEQNICLIRRSTSEKNAKFSDTLRDIKNIPKIQNSKRKSSIVEIPATSLKEIFSGKSFPSKSTSSKWQVDPKNVDNLLGMNIFSNVRQEEPEIRKDKSSFQEATKHPKRLITKFKKTSETIEIEDVSENDQDCSLKSLLKDKTYSSSEQFEDEYDHETRFEEAIESEYKMQILALKKEIEEKEEDIDVLTSQLKIKSLEIEHLMKAIPRELKDLL